MRLHLGSRLILTIIVIVSLALIVACGGAAEEETDSAPAAAPQATTAPQATAAPQQAATAVPAATAAPTTAAPTTAPAMMEGPEGVLNIGFKELGPYSASNKLTESTVWLYVATASHEQLNYTDSNGEFQPKVAESWTVDDSGSVWTFTLKKGVEFSKGYGEVTVDDYIFGAEGQVAPDSISSISGPVRRIFFHPDGGLTKIDDYTFELNTVEPQFDTLLQTALTTSNLLTSKKHFEEKGEEVAMFEGVGTGPWEYQSSTTGEVWRFTARENHHRKTPEFAELMMWEIPEESTRVANFQAGRLDSFQMAFDSKGAMDQVEDIRYISVPNGATEHLGFYGNWYVGHGEADFAERRPGYDPDLPWVSANPDVNSPEWEQARKVREALSIAIDRDLIVETLLGGEGSAQPLWMWENKLDFLDEDLRTIPYDPERAIQLLEEAGYPDGFEITLTPSIRGVAAEVEACEAISEMWEEIGIDTTIQRVPYLTQGPLIQARSYNQASCHGTAGRQHPLEIMALVFGSDSGWSAGFDHPIVDDLLDEAGVQTNDTDRWRVMNELARFIYENVLETGLYSVNVLWPLSSKVDSWAEHLEYGDTRSFGAYEWTKHRSQ